MPYTVPHTWVAGDFLRASWLNLTTTDLVDHEARIVALEATGTGNVTGQASSVDSEIALFSSTTGKVIKRATGTGYVKVTSGVMGTPAATVPLATDVSGDLPFANLTQGSALSVLGVTGNATADHASIVAASDGQVLRRSGTAVGFGAVDLANANAITGALPLANLPTNFAQIFKAVVTRTDAQIKALPTSAATIVAAPGSGLRIHPFSVSVTVNTSAGAYTNIHADAAMHVHTNDWSYDLFDYLVNGNSTSVNEVNTFLGGASRKRWDVKTAIYPGTAKFAAGWGGLSLIDDPAGSENQALLLQFENNGSGNLTGGNAANTMTIVCYYVIETVY